MRGNRAMPRAGAIGERPRATGSALVALLLSLFGVVALAGLSSPVAAFTLHAPIVINGNADFTPANGVTAGSGTPTDPYIIEGWEIDGSANSGIEVYNTDAHFVIRDVYVHSSLIDAIFFFSVRNGRVENATVSGNDGALYIQVSSNITVASSNISFNTLDAVVLDWSSNITVEGNAMWNNGDWGVFTYESDDLVIRNNTISNNGWAGIELSLGSDRILIQGNEVANNTVGGLILDTASNVTVIDNGFPDNDFNVDLTNSSDVLIRNNTVATSTADGITITGGARLTIEENNITRNGGGVLAVGAAALRVHHNVFDGNSPQAADDAGSVNAWDDGYPSGGNFWSDYAGVDNCSGPNQNVCPIPDGIGDTPYAIDADSRDRYPLMQPFGTAGPGYTVTIIPPLPGDSYTLPFGVNATGAVVGWSTTGGFERPFLYTDAGGTVPLPLAPNTTRGGALDISNTGIVVGFLFAPNQTHAFRWPAGGQPEDLGTMGGPTSRALGVNATGAVTGTSDDGGPLPKAFLYTNVTGFIDVAPLASGEALDVNDAGMVVGWAGAGAFRWSDGVMEGLGGGFGLDSSHGQAINQAGQVAGCVYSITPHVERAARFTDGVGWEAMGPESDVNCGTGINAYGDVVGAGRPTGVGIVRAFLYTNAGGMQDLELMTNRTPLLRLLAAYDINDRGQIVGYAWDNTVSQYVGYRLEPTVPQPPNHRPTVTVLAPNGGEFWGSGSTRPVEWRMTDLEDGVLSVTADLSVDSGATFPYPMFAGPIGQGKKTHPWTLPMLATTTARIRICVSDSEGLNACDVSDADFTIDPSGLVITVDTGPSGFPVRVDGVNRTAPYVIACAPATTHSVEVAATQPINWFSRYGFVGWSDGGARAHDIVCDANRTVAASYQWEWLLDLDTDPIGIVLLYDGVPVATPQQIWCAAGSTHVLEAPSPSAGAPGVRYVFDRWTDTSVENPRTHTCDRGAIYKGVYHAEFLLTLDTSPPGLTVVWDGGNLTAPATIWCPDLSIHTIAAPSPQFVGGNRYVFSSWSDGGAQSHPTMCLAPATIGASFLGPFLTAPSVTVTSPNGGEDWTGGSSHEVTWTMDDPDDPALDVSLELSIDGGATYPYPLWSGTLPIGPQSSSWTLPRLDTTTARVRVRVVDPRGTGAFDVSDTDFTIDSTPPAIASVSPSDGAVNVSLRAFIAVTFNETMNPAAFPPPGVTLAPLVSGIAPTWSPDGRTLTVSHDPFAPCTTYTATVAGGADISLPGNSMASPHAWSFATACPPTAAILEPVGGEDWTGGTSRPVRIFVMDDVDPFLQVWLNATAGAVETPVFAGPVPVGESAIPWTLPATTAIVTLHLDVADSSGMAAAASAASFTVDATPPVLVSVSPTDGSDDANLDTPVVLTFSEPMDRTATEAAVAVVPSTGAMSFGWDASSQVLTITFGAPLTTNTSYAVSLACGAGDDSDPGNSLAGCAGGGVRSTFRTELGPPVALAIAGLQARAGVPVTLDGRRSTGSVVTWTWTIVDGAGRTVAALEGPVVTYAFPEAGAYRVTLRVVDSRDRAHETSFEVAVAADGIPWVGIALAAAVTGAAALAASEPGRVAIASATVARLYARKPKDEKDSEVRGAIRAYIRVHPGDCYMEIKRNLGLNDGVVTYHLARLEREGEIRSSIQGARRRYYPVGMRIPAEDGGDLHEIQRRLLHAVAQEPGMPVAILAEQLGVSSQLALYHLRKLARTHRVGLERHALRLRVFPTTKD